jgi:hypothetical protein
MNKTAREWGKLSPMRASPENGRDGVYPTRKLHHNPVSPTALSIDQVRKLLFLIPMTIF